MADNYTQVIATTPEMQKLLDEVAAGLETEKRCKRCNALLAGITYELCQACQDFLSKASKK